MSGKSISGFIVWDVEKTAHGPVDLDTVITWIKEKRINSQTWIFIPKMGIWQRAAQVPELLMFFRANISHQQAAEPVSSLENPNGIDIRALRRLKILAGMTDEQL